MTTLTFVFIPITLILRKKCQVCEPMLEDVAGIVRVREIREVRGVIDVTSCNSSRDQRKQTEQKCRVHNCKILQRGRAK
jgi:hypothetical protein